MPLKKQKIDNKMGRRHSGYKWSEKIKIHNKIGRKFLVQSITSQKFGRFLLSFITNTVENRYYRQRSTFYLMLRNNEKISR